MNTVLSIVLALLLIAALVLAEIKRAVDLRAHWERDEHNGGAP
jgi:hypothetical protein